MPIISQFYGVTILIYYRDHTPPHIHAKYGDKEAIFDSNGNIRRGTLPLRAISLVREWMTSQDSELKKAFENIKRLKQINQIKPLD